MRVGLIAALLLVGASPALADDTSPADRQAVFAELPYWPGQWITENDESTIGGLSVAQVEARENGQPAARNPALSLFGFGAPWNDEGKARQAEARRTRGGRRADGWGYPMMMDAATPFQVMITPEETLIVNAYGETRHIYTDGRPFPAAEDMWPTVWGTSIGHWEGETLVIETVQVQMPYIYFHGAPTFSEEAHYFERIRLDGDRLIMEVRVEDPVTLTGPWGATITHLRDAGFDRMVQMDFSNDRTGNEDGLNTIEPPADERPAQ
jgi:hypothetical protein